MAIRVLHIIGSLKLGGAQAVLRQIVEHGDAARFEHFVYPLRTADAEIPIARNLLTHNRPNYDPRKFRDILRICRDKKIDIIHTHLHKDAVAGLLSTWFLDIPVIVHEHGAIFLPGLQYKIFRGLLRLLHGRATCFIANSKVTARKIAEVTKSEPGRIKLIYNAVNSGIFRPDPEKRKQIRRQLNLTDEHRVIGFVGRLHVDKGIDLLVAAMEELTKHNPCFRLLIVGNGPMESQLKQQAGQLGIADKIIFAGFQPNPADWINAFDIGCLPSRNESFGLAAAEVMAAGVPLICSGIDGLAELAQDNRNALILPQNTPEQIAAAVIRLDGDGSLQKQLTQNALAFSATLNIDSFIRNLEAVYTEIYRNKRR